MVKNNLPALFIASLISFAFSTNKTAFLYGKELASLTTLSDPGIEYRISKKPYAVVNRGDVRMVVVDNNAVDDKVLPGHRAGYSGIGSLTHSNQKQNLFVPAYAGLNFEHIHDGTKRPTEVLFEPRNFPMELRIVDKYTVELYQKPTPNYGLESCTRYRILEDGAIEMTVECIPHKKAFKNGYIGLFWASYINRPKSRDIHFRGHATDQQPASLWIRGVTPKHGELSTHIGMNDQRIFPHDRDFPLKLVFNRSNYRYSQPWYYGVSRGMALSFMFRPKDMIRLTQSPSGGGNGNPAWDFQLFIPDYQLGTRYQMVMRSLYCPYHSPEQIEKETLRHRQSLAAQ